MLTNEHCVTSNADVRNTDFEFGAEETSCGSTAGNCWMCQRGRVFSGNRLITDSSNRDFALVLLNNNPGNTYGWLELDNRLPSAGEPIFIPQHPNGRAKEFAFRDAATGSGLCEILGMNRRGCTSSAYGDVKYTCDTESGTSGSPVISRRTDKVVALHHCGGGCNGNLGVPIREIYDYV